MKPSRLRVYHGPQCQLAANAEPDGKSNTVTLPLEEVFPLLADAVHGERTWLADFADDEITISTDLYELILAYQHYRPSA